MKRLWRRAATIDATKLMVLAGVFYSSWPLGYWLNPEASRGLASDLQALHQPYNWVFISMDVICGVLVGIVSGKLLMMIRKKTDQQNLRGPQIAILGVGGFGLFTAVTALLPLDCIQGTPQCVVSLSNFSFLVHGIFSFLSIATLTISIIAIWLVLLLREQAVITLAHLTPTIFLIIWLSFGSLTLYLIMNNRSSTLAQHIFIGFCSLWLIVLPYLLRLVIRLQ